MRFKNYNVVYKLDGVVHTVVIKDATINGIIYILGERLGRSMSCIDIIKIEEVKNQ